MPHISPAKIPSHKYKQSEYEIASATPTRQMLIGQTNSGKTTLLSSLIRDVYKDVFDDHMIIASSVFHDPTYIPIIDFISKHRAKKGQDPDPECFCFPDYNEAELKEVVDKQIARNKKEKKENKNKNLSQLVIVCDDMSENMKFCRFSKTLQKIFLSGRHAGISCLFLTQIYRALSPYVRRNISCLNIFRANNEHEKNAILDEISGIHDRETIEDIYNEATKDKYQFLVIDMTKDPSKMFSKSLDIPISVE